MTDFTKYQGIIPAFYACYDKEGKVNIELIDLNRIRFRKISLKEGLDNLFERLPTDEHQHAIMEKAYLESRSL